MVTDCALFTLAYLGGIRSPQEAEVAEDDSDRTHSHINRGTLSGCEEAVTSVQVAGAVTSNGSVHHCYEWKGAGDHVVLTRGKKDTREESSEEEDKEEDGELCKKEALKVLCNVIYNSPRAQERASTLR